VARIDGPFQYLTDVLNDARCRDFLVDYNAPPIARVTCYLELTRHLDTCSACRPARIGAAKVYRDYLRLQRRGVA
jgi:predicted anti-sigma-YlaC factor YlaD